MNEETKDVLGQFCTGLLEDPRYTALRELYGQQMAVDMLQTAPNETKKREYLHAAYTGFQEFERLMGDFAEHYRRKYVEPAIAAPEESFED